MLKFIDLFCGIGGFRLALESIGGQCVFSAEINSHACQMYEANFKENPYCDITTLNENTLPEFDILCAGFPCQAFSSAGKKQGFKDQRGILFFDLCRIIEAKKPKILFLENVKNLINHDKGNTFKVIQDEIEKLNYHLSWKILSAKDFGVPQHRERIILIATRKDFSIPFDFTTLSLSKTLSLLPFLENDISHEYLEPSEYTIIPKDKTKQQAKSGLIFCGYRNKKLRINGVLPNTEHLSRTHKQFNRIYDALGIHPTISSQESSGRYFILENQQVRKLTLNECYTLMGFPSNFIKVGSKSNLYARIGNSVCVPMMIAVSKAIHEQYFNTKDSLK